MQAARRREGSATLICSHSILQTHTHTSESYAPGTCWGFLCLSGRLISVSQYFTPIQIIIRLSLFFVRRYSSYTRLRRNAGRRSYDASCCSTKVVISLKVAVCSYHSWILSLEQVNDSQPLTVNRTPGPALMTLMLPLLRSRRCAVPSFMGLKWRNNSLVWFTWLCFQSPYWLGSLIYRAVRDSATCVDYVARLWQWWRLLGRGLHSVRDNIHIELIAGAM